MPEEERGISPAIAIVGAGLGLGVLGILALVTLARAAPPEEPEPGLANLYGRVTDADTGAGISGVLVTADGLQTSTDAAGDYSFANLDTGSYRIRAEKEGYLMVSEDVTLVEGNNEVNVSLTPIAPVLANLYGTVTDAETGLPLVSVKVTIDSLTAYTNASGNYSFEGLTPGVAYTITFEKEGYETVTQ
ncbi:hypothetical protein ES708_00042 [subsurface metagenome]